MKRRHALFLIPPLALGSLAIGCEQWKAPDRVRELEKRVNELSSEVSALTGRPVGVGKSAEKAADEHGDDKDAKGKAKGKDAKAKGHAAADDEEEPDAKEPHGGGETKVAHPVAAHDEDAHDEPAAAPKPLVPAAAHGPAHWGYGRKDGPERWGELSPDWAACTTGEQQSPIDIEPKAGEAPAITFHYQPSKGTVVDNGHTLQVNLADAGEIEIEGHAYSLVQFHVHTPSEHTIAGEQYPLEVHLVHKDAAGKLAVIGVLFDSGDDSKAYDAVWGKWPAKVDQAVPLKKAFDPSTLLPEARGTFSYDGSLTTPPCSEGVLWNVMRRTKVAPRRLVDTFMKHHPDNARPVMPLGARKVI